MCLKTYPVPQCLQFPPSRTSCAQCNAGSSGAFHAAVRPNSARAASCHPHHRVSRSAHSFTAMKALPSYRGHVAVAVDEVRAGQPRARSFVSPHGAAPLLDGPLFKLPRVAGEVSPTIAVRSVKKIDRGY
jgi:hypothetical protein